MNFPFEVPVLFDDHDITVINKPPGLIVNRAESVKTETLQDWVEKQGLIESISGTDDVEFNSRSGIVHRIDKETSGILVIAKNGRVFAGLQQQFKERLIKKTYQAIVHGHIVPEAGEIRAPVGRLPWNREHFGVIPDGKEAVTGYKCLRRFISGLSGTGEKLSFVSLYPQTGRTHQIRVHLKYIGYPILGDYLYAGRKTARDDRKWVPRVMLHAADITFRHPVTTENISVTAPLPRDMMDIIPQK